MITMNGYVYLPTFHAWFPVCQIAGMKSPALVMALLAAPVAANWDAWWTYDGISGPAYWGLINPAWTMCNKASPYSFLTDNMPCLTLR